MKKFAVLIALVLLAVPAVAMPSGDWATNPDVCKIGLQLSTVTFGIYAWHNPLTSKWEVAMGIVGEKLSPVIKYGDKDGNVAIDMT
jgi:hypothetical protein